LFIFV